VDREIELGQALIRLNDVYDFKMIVKHISDTEPYLHSKLSDSDITEIERRIWFSEMLEIILIDYQEAVKLKQGA
jgi:hypothetical protein